MVLVGYTWIDVAEGVLWVSLALLILVIGYRWLLRYLQRGDVKHEEYCELYSLEVEPASGELPFYFTSPEVKSYTLSILDKDMNHLMDVVSQECKLGGNIVRFDSTKLPNGSYFYCLKTSNQKVVKKMSVRN